MKATPFEIILPIPADAKKSTLLELFLSEARRYRKQHGTPEKNVRRLVVTEGMSGFGSEEHEPYACFRITGVVVVQNDDDNPDPRDYRWGFFQALGEVRDVVKDTAPPRSLSVRATGGTFMIPPHELDHTAELAHPPQDGCDGERGTS